MVIAGNGHGWINGDADQGGNGNERAPSGSESSEPKNQRRQSTLSMRKLMLHQNMA